MQPGWRSAFRYDFALYWVALVTESFGLQMALVAIGWQVYSVRENPLDLGLVGLAEFLPLLLFALPAGQLADRFPRRRLLAIMVALDIVVLAGLLVVTAAGAGHVWPYFVLAFVFGVGSAIGAPAGRALTPSLIPPKRRCPVMMDPIRPWGRPFRTVVDRSRAAVCWR
jgi:MFS family permease